MKTIHLNYLISVLSLFLIFGCVTDKAKSKSEPSTAGYTQRIDTQTRTEICHNCRITFKTSLLAQKSQDPHTAGLCSVCSAQYHKKN